MKSVLLQLKSQFALLIAMAFTSNFILLNNLQAQVYTGDILLSSQAEVDAFRVNYNCEEIEGNLDIAGWDGAVLLESDITNLDSLSDLKSIDGNLSIWDNPILTDITGLSGLSGTLRGLHISENDSLKNLGGLEGISSVGELSIGFNGALTNLNSLSELKSIGGLLYIYDNPMLSDINGLGGLSTLKHLHIATNRSLKNLDGLEGITSVEYIDIWFNDALENVEGISNINSVEKDVQIQNNPVLVNCCSLYPLVSSGVVNGTINISNNGAQCTETDILANGPCDGGGALIVNAKGSEADGVYAHFRVLVDGQEIGDTYTTSNYESFAFTLPNDPGMIEEVRVVFDNDAVIDGKDRNLYVQSIEWNGEVIPAPGDNVSYMAGTGLKDYHGIMPWRGELIILLTEIVHPIPYTYNSFQGDTYDLYLWEGEKVAILSKESKLDKYIMQKMLDTFDKVYDYYNKTTGRKPGLYFHYKEKITIAQVDHTCGAGCAYLGHTGIELLDSYFDKLYSTLRDDDLYNQIVFYEFGRNFWFYGNRIKMESATTGYAIFMRFMSMKAAEVNGAPFKGRPFAEFENEVKSLFDKYMVDASLNWENTINIGKAPANSMNLGGADFFASFMFKLVDLFGNEFNDAIWKEIEKRPHAVNQYDAADNFILASSIVAKQNLIPLFNDWKWPISQSAIEEANQLFGTSLVVVNAKGSEAGGVYAHFRVLVDGQEIGDGYTTSDYKSYAFTFPYSPDMIQEVRVVFDNDAVIDGKDRNLYVQNIECNGEVIPASGDNVTYMTGTGMRDYHGIMPWRGELIFDTIQCAGDITLSSQAEVDAFRVNFNCEEIKGNLSISGWDGAVLLESDITNLDSLSDLKSIDGSLYISDNPLLTDITGLSGLSGALRGLHISENSSLKNFDGLEGISSVGELSIGWNGSLTNLNSLSELKSIGGLLYIYDNPVLSDIKGLSGLSDALGGLHISENSSLKNLDGLEGITSVGSIGIWYNGALENIDGLSELKSIGGYLSIGHNPVLSDIKGLSGLSGELLGLQISENSSLTNLEGLSGLSNVTDLTIENNPSLSPCCDLYPLLSSGGVSGTINISNNGPGCTELDIINGPCSGICEGDITLASQAEVDVFNCDEVVSNLFISGSDIINLDGLSGLTEIDSLYIGHNEALDNLEGLLGLTKVRSLTLQSNNQLTNLNGLSGLTEILGSLTIYGNDQLINLDGLSGLSHVTDLTIENNPSLSPCCVLYPLLSSGGVSGTINILNNGPECTELGIMANGPCTGICEGDITLSSQAAVDACNCIEIKGNLEIGEYYDSDIANLSALSELKSIGGGLYIFCTDVLDLNGLSGLSGQIAELSIHMNGYLKNLDGLEGITSVESGIEICLNGALENLNGLSAMRSLGGDLYIYGNWDLKQCCGLYPLLNEGTIGGTVDISLNGAGCTEADIIANGPCDEEGERELIVNAKGSEAGGVYAHFRVLVDGQEIGDVYSTSDYKSYAFKVPNDPEMIQEVGIVFDNDAMIDGSDRNLYVKSIELNGEVITATRYNTTYMIDDQIKDYQGVMPWRGTLIFDVSGLWSLSASTNQLRNMDDPGLENVLDVGGLEMSIYPNPAEVEYNIELKNASEGQAKLVMNDLYGRNVLIRNFSVDETCEYQTVDVSQLDKGVYILNLITGDDLQLISKVIVE